MASIPMVYIPGGLWEGDKGQVPLPPFWASRYLVTQEEYMALTGDNPGMSSSSAKWVPNMAVENVNWFQCAHYMNQLSFLDGLRPAYWFDGETSAYIIPGAEGYRIPTVAEWDWIRGSGGAGGRYGYSDNEEECTWTTQNSVGKFHAVGTKKPTQWGVYDIASATWKWTSSVAGDHPATQWSNLPPLPQFSFRGPTVGGRIF